MTTCNDSLYGDNIRYYITEDFNSTYNFECFEIDGDNVTLDCQGHTINHITDEWISRYILEIVYSNNVTIMNCNLNTTSVGSRISDSSNINFVNSSINTSYNMFDVSNVNNLNLINSTITRQGSNYFYISNSVFSFDNVTFITVLPGSFFYISIENPNQCASTFNDVTINGIDAYFIGNQREFNLGNYELAEQLTNAALEIIYNAEAQIPEKNETGIEGNQTEIPTEQTSEGFNWSLCIIGFCLVILLYFSYKFLNKSKN